MKIIVKTPKGVKVFTSRKRALAYIYSLLEKQRVLENEIVMKEKIDQLVHLANSSHPIKIRDWGVVPFRSYCRVCGRTLTDPESVKLGIGPECSGKKKS